MRVARGTLSQAHGVVLLGLLAGGWAALAARDSVPAAGAAGAGREVTCTYLAQISGLPREARTVQIWIPLARTSREQRILRRDIHAPVPYTIAQDSDYGNHILHATLTPPLPEHLEIAVTYRAQLLGADTEAPEAPPARDELKRSLRSSGLVIVDEEVRARAQQATAGRRTRLARARGIYDHVRHTVAYDTTVPGWGRGDTRRVCLLGKGNCTDFHSLFISLARAARIPARFKIGVVIPQQPAGIIPGYHCWAEFHAPGQGWVAVDASEAWKHPELADYYFGAQDPNRFLISVGRGIRLVPRQQGEPVNIFFAPYVEVDGRVFGDVDVEVRFADLQHGRMT